MEIFTNLPGELLKLLITYIPPDIVGMVVDRRERFEIDGVSSTDIKIIALDSDEIKNIQVGTRTTQAANEWGEYQNCTTRLVKLKFPLVAWNSIYIVLQSKGGRFSTSHIIDFSTIPLECPEDICDTYPHTNYKLVKWNPYQYADQNKSLSLN